MAHDARQLFAQISVRLDKSPSCSLMDLAREFRVSTKDIEHVVARMTNRAFSKFQDDILIAKLTRLFVARPAASIEELSLDLGYKSSRSFARHVRRACGANPQKLRLQIAAEIAAQKVHPPSKSSYVQ
jgi:AraC-like DNA-binding protein